MIIASAQAQYDAYWNAYRAIRQSGLLITTDPHVGPMLAQARATYMTLVNMPNVGFNFAGFRDTWLNVAQHVAYRASQELAHPTGNVDVARLAVAVAALGTAVGVDLIGEQHVVAQPGGIPGMFDYMDLVDQ